ncbi:exo-alpha-sialidase [Trypanosoma cruzi]|nr:exo-alpha-sialidase [Trypanosoma cruzi]
MVPPSLLFPCDKFPRLLLSAAAFTSLTCECTSSFCASVPSAFSQSSPEFTLISFFTAGSTFPSPLEAGVFASAEGVVTEAALDTPPAPIFAFNGSSSNGSCPAELGRGRASCTSGALVAGD